MVVVAHRPRRAEKRLAVGVQLFAFLGPGGPKGTRRAVPVSGSVEPYVLTRGGPGSGISAAFLCGSGGLSSSGSSSPLRGRSGGIPPGAAATGCTGAASAGASSSKNFAARAFCCCRSPITPPIRCARSGVGARALKSCTGPSPKSTAAACLGAGLSGWKRPGLDGLRPLVGPLCGLLARGSVSGIGSIRGPGTPTSGGPLSGCGASGGPCTPGLIGSGTPAGFAATCAQ